MPLASLLKIIISTEAIIYVFVYSLYDLFTVLIVPSNLSEGIDFKARWRFQQYWEFYDHCAHYGIYKSSYWLIRL